VSPEDVSCAATVVVNGTSGNGDDGVVWAYRYKK